MQIFMMSYNPKISASRLYMLDWRRGQKQIVESVQALSDYCGNPEGAYKPCNVNHPVVHWLHESSDNVRWTIENLIELSSIYTLRQDKVHKSYSKFLEFKDILESFMKDKESKGITEMDFSRFNEVLKQFQDLPRPKAFYKYIAERMGEKFPVLRGV